MIVGCGNLIRGDDAGPVLVRQLADRALPDGVRLIDGGTAGWMSPSRCAVPGERSWSTPSRVGVPAGTIHKVPWGGTTDLKPPEGNLHQFRWDQALGFAQWLLKDEYPPEVTVWLIEGSRSGPGSR